MTKYKVFGDMLFEFFIDVEANSEDEAWDIASAAETHKWTQILKDNTIDVHFVEQLKDTLDLEDGYPSMDNDIVVMDKSDKTDIQDSVGGGPIGWVTGVFTNSRNSYIINTDHRKDQYNGNKA